MVKYVMNKFVCTGKNKFSFTTTTLITFQICIYCVRLNLGRILCARWILVGTETV